MRHSSSIKFNLIFASRLIVNAIFQLVQVLAFPRIQNDLEWKEMVSLVARTTEDNTHIWPSNVSEVVGHQQVCTIQLHRKTLLNHTLHSQIRTVKKIFGHHCLELVSDFIPMPNYHYPNPIDQPRHIQYHQISAHSIVLATVCWTVFINPDVACGGIWTLTALTCIANHIWVPIKSIR